MTHDSKRPPAFASREQRLDACLRQLLDVTELNMDDMEDETREAIREALQVLQTDSTSCHGR
jgi:hypothetical protein